MRLVLLGPPGAGKGTLAKRLSERYGWPHVATGDIFRRNVAERTEVGMLAKAYLDRGELVTDDLTGRMVIEELPRIADGFILDGFPRNLAQAELLDRELGALDRPLSAALALLVDEETAVNRIAGRRTCSSCQRVYNVVTNPPKRDGVCDVCGGRLVQRSDEDEATVRRRLEVYHESTEPLLDFYRERGILHEIDASGPEEQVAALAEGVLAELGVASEHAR